MQRTILRIGLFLICGLLTVSATADVLYLSSGASVAAQILSFDGKQYRVLIEGETYTYQANEVKGFAIDRRGQISEANDEIVDRLLSIEEKIDRLSLSYEETSANMQQKIYNLNPVSQLRILSQKAIWGKDKTYIISGQMTNDSNMYVRNFRLRATLYDSAGNLIRTVDSELLANLIGPGQRKNYKIEFPNAPSNPGRVEIVPYVLNRSSDDDIGDYQQRNPAAPYRN